MKDVYVQDGRLVTEPTDEPRVVQEQRLRKLHKLAIDRVDLVAKGANPGAKVLLYKSVDALAVLEKANAESARTGDTGTAPGIATPISPTLPMQAATTPTPTLDGGQGLGDQGQGQSPDIGPGPDPLGELVRRLDDMVRRGVVDQPTASAMYTKAKLAQAAADASAPYWTQSDSINKSYLTAEQARENVSRPADELELRKALRRRERSVTPLTKSQGLLIAARVFAKMSQTDAARASGFSKSLISMIESGQAPVTGSVALQLAEVYKLKGADALTWCREVSRPKTEG